MQTSMANRRHCFFCGITFAGVLAVVGMSIVAVTVAVWLFGCCGYLAWIWIGFCCVAAAMLMD